MARIGIGKQQAHRHRLHTGGEELAHRAFDIIGLQRFDDLPARIEPLANLEYPVAREQHLRAGCEQVEDVLTPPLAADLVDVAKSPCGYEADPRAFAFEQRVERDG